MRVLPLLLFAWLGVAVAQDAAPPAGEDKSALQERAKALREQAATMRRDAEAALVADNKACWDRFLVTKCMDEAKLTKIERLAAARRLEQEARDIERGLRQRNFDEHEAKATEEAPRRAADAAARAEKNRQAQQEAMERVERKQTEAEQREHR